MAAPAKNVWDCATLRREQLDNDNMGPILEEGQAGKHPKWNIIDCSPIYKS
jgi:hypothetical protein